MHDNKLYKILRIVFLTLAIISLVFTLCKKVGLCADSPEYSRADIGGVCWYGFSPFTLDEIQAFDQKRISDPWYANNHTDTYFIEIYSQDSNYYYIRFVYQVSNLLMSSSKYGDGTQLDALNGYYNGNNLYLYGTNFAVGFRVDKTTHLIVDSEHYATWYGNYDFVYFLPETFTPGVAYTSYPFYCNSDFFTTKDGAIFLTQGGYLPSNSLVNYDDLQSVIDSTTDFSGDMGDLIDSLPTDSGNTSIGQWLSNIFGIIGGGFQGLFRNIYQFFEPYLQGILDFFSDIYDKIVDFAADVSDWFQNLITTITSFFNSVKRVFDWFYEHGQDSDHQFDFMILFHYLFDFDSDAALDAFEENKYGDFILDVRDFGSTVYNSITGASASERVFFTISLGDHFGTHFDDIVIDFDWYANVRDMFLPYLMAFLYVSAIWLFFKRLPDIIHGVASAESSFTDGLPPVPPEDYDTYTETHVSSGTYISRGHISGDGRRRVFYNKFISK